VDKEELLKFRKSTFGSRNVLKDFSALQDWAFFYSLARIFRESVQIFKKCTVFLDKKDSIKFGTDLDLDSGYV